MKASGKPAKPTARRHSVAVANAEVVLTFFVWLDNSLVLQTAGELYAGVSPCPLGSHWRTGDWHVAGRREYLRSRPPEFLVRKVAVVLQQRRVRESLRLRILAEAAEQVVES